MGSKYRKTQKLLASIFGITFSIVSFVSCVMEPDNKAGKIIVQNQSYDSTLEISDVWLKEPGSIDWVNYWHGSCKGDSEYINELSFNLDPGTYNVKIKVIKYGIFYRYYETGYMQPVIIKRDDSKFVIYDGNGIYDMEKYQ